MMRSVEHVRQVVNTAGVSPNMAPPERVLAVDLYGSAVIFEEFGRVIAPGGAGLVISSMAGYMLPALPSGERGCPIQSWQKTYAVCPESTRAARDRPERS